MFNEKLLAKDLVLTFVNHVLIVHSWETMTKGTPRMNCAEKQLSYPEKRENYTIIYKKLQTHHTVKERVFFGGVGGGYPSFITIRSLRRIIEPSIV